MIDCVTRDTKRHVTAHVEVIPRIDDDDANVGLGVVSFHDNSAKHVMMTSGLQS